MTEDYIQKPYCYMYTSAETDCESRSYIMYTWLSLGFVVISVMHASIVLSIFNLSI